MGEKAVGRIKPFAASGFDGMAEMHGVPVDDDGGEQVEARDPVVLALPSRTLKSPTKWLAATRRSFATGGPWHHATSVG